MAKHEVAFTKANLDALPLPIPGQRTTYYDTKTNGLQIRVTSTGVKTFCVFRWIGGEAKPERVTLGRYPDLTIEQARKKAAEINAQIAKGENPADKRRAAKAEMAFTEFWKEYLERYAYIRKKLRTVEEDKKTYRNYLAGWRTTSYLRSLKPIASVYTTILPRRHLGQPLIEHWPCSAVP